MNGGYILVDCKGLNLMGGETPQKIEGIWDTASAALKSDKPIVVHNCVLDDNSAVSAIPCFGYLDADEIVIVGAMYEIHITDDDTCTVLDVTT